MKETRKERKTPEFVNTAKKAAQIIQKTEELEKVFSYQKEGNAVEVIGMSQDGNIKAYNGIFSGNTFKLQFITTYVPATAERVNITIDGNIN